MHDRWNKRGVSLLEEDEDMLQFSLAPAKVKVIYKIQSFWHLYLVQNVYKFRGPRAHYIHSYTTKISLIFFSLKGAGS